MNDDVGIRTATLRIGEGVAQDAPVRRLAGYRVEIAPSTVRLAFAGDEWSAFPTDEYDEDGLEVWEIR